jgi:phosphoribosylanthranilate isomerase
VIAVKICGVMDPEDAREAARLGASAVGMVFWPGSPRCVDVDRARAIVAALPPFVTAVGVFVDQAVEEVKGIADAAHLGAIQLHGDEDASAYGNNGRRVIKAIPLTAESNGSVADRVPTHATVLLDAHDPVKRGGTGRTIDWTVAAVIARQRPVILSGGLTPDNIVAAVRTVDPYAVDVSSGVESSPGRKDRTKLRALFDALRTL